MATIKTVENEQGKIFSVGDMCYWDNCEDRAVIENIFIGMHGVIYLKFDNPDYSVRRIDGVENGEHICDFTSLNQILDLMEYVGDGSNSFCTLDNDESKIVENFIYNFILWHENESFLVSDLKESFSNEYQIAIDKINSEKEEK